jgi:rRNA maturation RNase YbeY
MIYHHAEDVTFSPPSKLSLRKWISNTILEEGKTVGDINYIYCSDVYILDLNKSSLDHDYYTDIITFDYVEESVISGDLFISIDRVADNAKTQDVSFIDELHRVMIHGVLHLCGFGDKSKEEEKQMRSKEDFYLKKRDF